jgi:putative ABC transport system substrate-binding protein
MKRRAFIAGVGSVVAWPMVARPQTSAKRPLIVFLSVVVRERNLQMEDAFIDGLRQLNYVAGRDFDFALRSADGHLDRLPLLAEEVIQLKPDVILATVVPSVLALKAQTQTIPIVCPFLADPIRYGLIASESRPGGNVTGVLFRVEGLAGKQVELALELIPHVVKVGLLVNVATETTIDRQEAETASQRVGIDLIPAEVRVPDDLDNVS